jgi:hypothetical protein
LPSQPWQLKECFTIKNDPNPIVHVNAAKGKKAKAECPFCGELVTMPKSFLPGTMIVSGITKYCGNTVIGTIQGRHHPGQILHYECKEMLELTTWGQLMVKNMLQDSLVNAINTINACQDEHDVCLSPQK